MNILNMGILVKVWLSTKVMDTVIVLKIVPEIVMLTACG